MKVFHRLRFFLLCIGFFLLGFFLNKINLHIKVAHAIQGALNFGTNTTQTMTIKNITSYQSDMVFGTTESGKAGVLKADGTIALGVGTTVGTTTDIANPTTPYITTTAFSGGGGGGSMIDVKPFGVIQSHMRLINTTGDRFLRVFDNGDANIVRYGAGGLGMGTSSQVKMFIDASGNVGVGTTSPVGKLDTRGSTYFNNGNIDGTFGDQVFFGAAPAGYPSSYLHKIKTSHSASTTAGAMTFSLNNGTAGGYTDVMTLLENGNVGIGSAQPGQKLTVSGVVESTTGGFKFPDGTTMTSAYSLSGTTNRLAKFNTAGNSVIDSQIFDNGTNVGIGSISPTAKLDVVGQDIKFLSGTANNTLLMGRNATEHLSFYHDDASAYIESVQDENTPGFGNLIFRVDNDGTADGIFAFQNKAGTEFLRIGATGNVGVGSTSPGAKLDVSGTNSIIANTAGNMSIVPAVNLLVTQGNVGIGTTSTSNRLEVNGDTGLKITRTSNPDQSVTITGGNGSGIASINASYQLNLNSNSASFPLTMQIAGSEKMRVHSDGNVGIGSAAPTSKLDVVGEIRNASAANVAPYTQSRITAYRDGTNWGYLGYGSDAILRLVYGREASNVPFYIGTSTAYDNTGSFNPKVTVLGNGNVGINSTTPGAKLDVSGGANISGNVGIGTTNPGSSKLTVTATTSFGSYNFTGSGFNSTIGDARLKGATQEIPMLMLHTGDAVNPFNLNFELFGNTTSSLIYASIQASDYGTATWRPIAINPSGGNVGIGTTAPADKLDVAGSIRTTAGYGPTALGSPNYLKIGAGGTTPNAASIAWGDNSGWKLNFGTIVASVFTPRVSFVDSGQVDMAVTQTTTIYTCAATNPEGDATCEVACPAGTTRMGGGGSGWPWVKNSYPVSTNSWHCDSSSAGSGSIGCYIICGL